MPTTPPRHHEWKEARRRTHAVTFVSLCFHLSLGLWLASPATATEIYHSPADDGAPAAGAPVVAEGGVQPVHLYVDGGPTASTPGTVCDDGQGDEVCGFVVTFSSAGGLSFDSFIPDGAADVLVNQSGGTIVINHLDPVAPAPGPQRVGVLYVNAVAGGSVERVDGEVIGADLGSEPLASQTLVTVPEPSLLASWAAGCALLAALGRRRGSR